MIIEEHMKVSKNGKEVVEKTSNLYLPSVFASKMRERGIECFTYCVDKSQPPKEADPTKNNEEDLEDYFDPSLCMSHTDSFDNNDFVDMVMIYLNRFNNRQKLNLISQIHNLILADIFGETDDDMGGEEYGYDSI